MIPKIIHYCWFGGKPKPEDVKKYLASWKKLCPDYEIREWNESNFDVNENAYCREAYEAKKWAFVTDYVRLKALYEYGGIYMDTDVEIVKPLDELLIYDAFMCFETNDKVSIGTFGSKRKTKLLKDLLNEYQQMEFKWNDAHTMTNLTVVTNLLIKKYNLKCNGKSQRLIDNIMIFPREAFIAKDYNTGLIMANETTYAVHHYAASWLPEDIRKYRELYQEYYYMMKKSGVPEKVAFYGSRVRAMVELQGISGLMRKMLK
jgi:hypothetical protein